jgi:peptidoglycan hydrolase FlgJ
MTPGVAPAAAPGTNLGAPSAWPAGANPARAAAQDFEAVYLNTMFQQMFTALDGEGPFGGGAGAGVWRSFLTDEYARTFAKAGGIGIADQVYKTLIAQQEIAPR